MSAPLGELSPEQFLAEYWQKKPCLIRRAIADFKPLIDGDDLAGLACEEMADSRLITGSMETADWEVRNGPFTDADFSALPERNWTLLVQDVEKHYSPKPCNRSAPEGAREPIDQVMPGSSATP